MNTPSIPALPTIRKTIKIYNYKKSFPNAHTKTPQTPSVYRLFTHFPLNPKRITFSGG